MALFLQQPDLFSFISYEFAMLVAITIFYVAYRRKPSIYLVDFACYKPPQSNRLPVSMLIEHLVLDPIFDDDSVTFQAKILQKSGFSDETSGPHHLSQLPIPKKLYFAIEETENVLFSIVGNLLKKTNISPKAIDILICNSSMFSPTPSLSTMIANKFKMRSNVKTFNLSGMGCSAGIISIGLAKDLLSLNRNSLALIVSTELLNLNWYTGTNRSMLLTNCLFRAGGVAMFMSNKNQDKRKSKYELKHVIRTVQAQNDQSYNCVFQDVDSESNEGVSISKNILNVAADALKTNITSLGPLVLPLSEQFKYILSFIRYKIRILGKTTLYTPKFKRAFEHFCVHAGGKAVIQSIERNLMLQKQDVEASKMTLYRFGNTSSSSIWYELSYTETKGRMKKGDRVWQIAFGSGFKCNSAVWKCINRDIGNNIASPWRDDTYRFPVEIPDSSADINEVTAT